MKEAVNFLRQVYFGSVHDVIAICNAEAEKDSATLIKYLKTVRDYVDGLISRLEKQERPAAGD